MPDATVIIPTRARAEILGLTLPFLARQTVPHTAWELVVVDDGSPDAEAEGTREAVARYPLPNVRLMRQPSGGASRARNAALAVARGRVLVFLDDDAFVGPNFLARHLQMHDGERTIAAGGIVQVRAIPTAVDESRRFLGYHRHPLPGGNASALREDVCAAGGFDPWFSMYGWQDQELAQRLIARGARRRFVGGAPILHYKPRAYDSDMRAQLARERERGRMGARLYHKHPSLAVGITTKCWPPLHRLIAVASQLTATDQLRKEIMRGAVEGAEVPAWRRALARVREESEAARAEAAEIERVTSESPRGSRGQWDSAHDSSR